jgi:hypothetical protein
MLELRTFMNFPVETKAYLTLPMVAYFTYVISDVRDLPKK